MLHAEIDQHLLASRERINAAMLDHILAAVHKRRKAQGELSIAFVDEAEIKRINRVYRKKDAVTDVLAFELPLGEVLICYRQAKRQAAERGHTVKQEVMDLLIHGILHVLGLDHERPKDARVMLPLQKKIYDEVTTRK